MTTMTIAHPEHPVPEEVAEGLRHYTEQQMAAAAAQFEFARLARPTGEEREQQGRLYEGSLRSMGLNIEDYRTRAAAIRRKQFDRIQYYDRQGLPSHLNPVEMDFTPAAPERSDPSFWWANSNFFASAPYSVDSQPDGLHFRGKKTYDGGSLLGLTYGYTSRFELHHNRIPRPNAPPWRSAPHVELFGELLAWTETQGIFDGDRWSKCWMIRRQTLFQFVFAAPGESNRRVIGEAVEVQQIFNEENSGRSVVHRLPGFQPMPVVILTGIPAPQSIWAELEVRFDIQLEGNALHWIHPFDLLIRGFQWPLQAI